MLDTWDIVCPNIFRSRGLIRRGSVEGLKELGKKAEPMKPLSILNVGWMTILKTGWERNFDWLLFSKKTLPFHAAGSLSFLNQSSSDNTTCG